MTTRRLHANLRRPLAGWRRESHHMCVWSMTKPVFIRDPHSRHLRCSAALRCRRVRGLHQRQVPDVVRAGRRHRLHRRSRVPASRPTPPSRMGVRYALGVRSHCRLVRPLIHLTPYLPGLDLARRGVTTRGTSKRWASGVGSSLRCTDEYGRDGGATVSRQ
jgi:hypothetical protein